MEEAGPVPRARLTRLQLAIVGVGLGFVALTALVVAGALSDLDHHALEHWMFGLDASEATDSVPSAWGFIRPFKLDEPWWQTVLDVATYPASVFVSVSVFAAGCILLVRRGYTTAAVVWGSAFVLANAVEVALKVGLEKPNLYLAQDDVSYHVASFDHSYPSGHTMRAVLVAGFLVFLWRRLAWPAWIWVALVPACLVVSSAHVPTDTGGGLLFGVLVVLLVYATLGVLAARRA